MPKSRNRKNHKKKVEAWKNRNQQRVNAANKEIMKMSIKSVYILFGVHERNHMTKNIWPKNNKCISRDTNPDVLLGRKPKNKMDIN